MSAVGLPARIVYALMALPVGGAAGFYSVVWVIPKMSWLLQAPNVAPENYTTFVTALYVGGAVAFTASLVALTLPWKRRRKRRGRSWRIALAGVFVVVAAAVFADLGHTLLVDFAFAAWLAYTVTFTFVRYGVLDQARRASSLERAASPGSGED
jgi:hypothetical protein